MMKSTIIKTLVSFAVMVLAMSLSVAAQNPVPRFIGGVGPVLAGSVDTSSLPKQALGFIQKNFRGAAVVECEKEFATQTFDVELADGTDIEFDKNGNWIEIDAGNADVLPEALVHAVLPKKAYRELEKQKMNGYVESIKRGRNGDYKVELRELLIEECQFDKSGKLMRSRH